MESKELSINIGNGRKLVAKAFEEPRYPTIQIFVREANGEENLATFAELNGDCNKVYVGTYCDTKEDTKYYKPFDTDGAGIPDCNDEEASKPHVYLIKSTTRDAYDIREDTQVFGRHDNAIKALLEMIAETKKTSRLYYNGKPGANVLENLCNNYGNDIVAEDIDNYDEVTYRVFEDGNFLENSVTIELTATEIH